MTLELSSRPPRTRSGCEPGPMVATLLNLSVIALTLSSLNAGAAEVTNVSTPSGSTHGGLVGGNIPCAIAANEIGDCAKTAPASAIVGTSDTQTLSNKTISGAQNTLANIPDSALSANVDLLSAAQSATGLKTFSGGLALPSGSDPAGSNFYVDSNQCLHFFSTVMDAMLPGCKFSGDSSRPWFTTGVGFGLTNTSSGGQPNIQINRNDKFNGGSGLQFAQRVIYAQGNGVSEPTTAAFAIGASTITVTPNANFAVGQPLYGAGMAANTTISSYSNGTIGLSSPLSVNIKAGTQITACISSCAPTNQPVGIEAEVDQYTDQTSSVAAPNALEGYLFKWIPSTEISEGANIVCRDWTGRKSSVAGPCIAAELDTVASGPDDNQDRYIFELTGAEGEPSADGATDIFAGIRIRPQTAESQPTPNAVMFDNGILVTTMPSGATNGVYGSFAHGFNCDGGETTGCHDAVSGTLAHTTSALAAASQNQIQFALPTSINAGQVISGNASIPTGTTVSAIYQCDPVNQLTGCGAVTNATLVVLSNNLTGSIASGTSLMFTGALTDGSNFNAWFTDAFANWTNQNGTGWLKAGTTSNSGAVFDIRGLGEDSTNAMGVDYGDLTWAIDTNTHGATLGHIAITNAGFEIGLPTGGNEGVGSINAQAIYQNGSALGTFAFQSFATPPAIGVTTPNAGSFTTITANNDLTTKAHTISSGTPLSCSSVVFGASAGTSPTCNSVTGDDRHFNINFTTGTSPSGSAVVFTITFNSAYGATPNCTFAAVGGNTASGITKFYVTSTTSTAVLNDTSSALAASTAYNFNVQCIQ